MFHKVNSSADVTTISIAWAVTLVAEHPEIITGKESSATEAVKCPST